MVQTRARTAVAVAKKKASDTSKANWIKWRDADVVKRRARQPKSSGPRKDMKIIQERFDLVWERYKQAVQAQNAWDRVRLTQQFENHAYKFDTDMITALLLLTHDRLAKLIERLRPGKFNK